ncbi:YozE family protein [Furfurilactobacillus sp. WILCCON 0119]|uniref:YozE family protein n=1 Tax=Furfurilactobacillus entadae TaxID=2922307 RepID=UPI0035EE4D82
MRRSFYQFLMTQRNSDSYDPVAQFANNAFLDQAFPKQAENFDDVSSYLELNARYLPSMDVFDDAWHLYLDSEA